MKQSHTVLHPCLMRNKIQHYQWGSKGKDAFIPRLLCLEPENDKPYAELWIGVHPNAPSEIFIDNRWQVLPDVLRTRAVDILGNEVIAKFGPTVPFLLKVLSAAEALSIQAHPNKQQAGQLHQRDPEHYPDDNHKPEIAVAVTSLTALVGFRTIPEIQSVLSTYPPIAEFAGESAHAFQQLVRGDDGRDALKALYANIMNRAISQPDDLEQALHTLEQQCRRTERPSEQERLFLELRSRYGTDVGLFSLFLLSLVHLQAGEAVFLPAGVPHAYLKGDIVECMANSDNVVRAGLTPKFKDVATLVDILTFETAPIPIMRPDPARQVQHYSAPVDEFLLSRFHIGKNEKRTVSTYGKLQILLILDGSISLQGDDHEQRYHSGQSVLVPATTQSYHIVSHEHSTIFLVNIP